MPTRCAAAPSLAPCVVVVLLFLFAAWLGPASARTCAAPQRDASVTVGGLSELIRRMQGRILQVVSFDQNGRPYFSLVPSLVRLAFHACSANWCSSRVDFGDELNRGLERAVHEADGLWQALQLEPAWTGFSKADVYALYAVAAVEVATQFKVRVPFRYGRPDFCPGDDPSAHEQTLPSRNLDPASLFPFMKRWLNLTRDETVTIMGAHSLGVLRDFASPPKPAFRWVQGVGHRLSNEYYAKLLDHSWRQVDRLLPGAEAPLKQWESRKWPRLLMLNSDMVLVRDLVSAGNGSNDGVVQCTTYDSCPRADTANKVSRYAFSNTAFLHDFGKAFAKMIENGLGDKLVGVSMDAS